MKVDKSAHKHKQRLKELREYFVAFELACKKHKDKQRED